MDTVCSWAGPLSERKMMRLRPESAIRFACACESPELHACKRRSSFQDHQALHGNAHHRQSTLVTTVDVFLGHTTPRHYTHCTMSDTVVRDHVRFDFALCWVIKTQPGLTAGPSSTASRHLPAVRCVASCALPSLSTSHTLHDVARPALAPVLAYTPIVSRR